MTPPIYFIFLHYHYLGAFPENERKKAVEDWQEKATELGVAYSEDYSLQVHMAAFSLFCIFAPICKNHFRKKVLCKNAKMKNQVFVSKLPKMD